MSLILKINRIYDENISQEKQILKFEKCKIKFRRSTQTILLENDKINSQSKKSKSEKFVSSDVRVNEPDQENENLLSKTFPTCEEIVFLLGSEIETNESLKIEFYKKDAFYEKYFLIL